MGAPGTGLTPTLRGKKTLRSKITPTSLGISVKTTAHDGGWQLLNLPGNFLGRQFPQWGGGANKTFLSTSFTNLLKILRKTMIVLSQQEQHPFKGNQVGRTAKA